MVACSMGERQSIYERVQWKGLLNTVWGSTPFPLNVLGLPYGLWVYKNLLRRSATLGQLASLHSEQYLHSLVFRVFRPRLHRAQRILAGYGIES